MFHRLLKSAFCAGAIAALVATLAQIVAVTPAILQAERHENAHDHAPMAHGAIAWAPADGVERLAATALGNLVLSVGFALILCACFVVADRKVTWRRGLLWGMGGFLAMSLLPAIGLPPSLPGADLAPVGVRQVWWLITALLSAVGLALIAFKGGWLFPALGGALLLLPHILGAPRPQAGHAGDMPHTAAAEFVVLSLATAALFWAVLGASSGWMFARFAKGRSSG